MLPGVGRQEIMLLCGPGVESQELICLSKRQVKAELRDCRPWVNSTALIILGISLYRLSGIHMGRKTKEQLLVYLQFLVSQTSKLILVYLFSKYFSEVGACMGQHSVRCGQSQSARWKMRGNDVSTQRDQPCKTW